MLKAVFLDLDYTLYDQRQYLTGALANVANTIASECQLDGELLHESLLILWEQLGTDYSYLFNEWLAECGILSLSRVKRCIEAFHAYQPQQLTLYEGVDQTLHELRNKFLLGLITDGDIQMQQSKVEALNLRTRFDLIVYARELALSKPDPRIFKHALGMVKLSATETIYVGDHPVKDIVGARRAGLPAFRVMTGEFRKLPDDPLYRPTQHLAGVSDLLQIIRATSLFTKD